MGASEDRGPDWLMLQALEEQEQRAEETLRKIYTGMVLCGDLEKERFNEIVYLTGCRAKFE